MEQPCFSPLHPNPSRLEGGQSISAGGRVEGDVRLVGEASPGSLHLPSVATTVLQPFGRESWPPCSECRAFSSHLMREGGRQGAKN